jgi:hypothetical protein
VPLVVALLEAVGAERHARGYAASAAPVGHEIRGPDQTASGRVVVSPHCNRDLRRRK